MEFGGVESEKELGVVVFGESVSLLCVVDLGRVYAWDGFELLNGLESFNRQQEILKRVRNV